jgi:hypothetical protein
LPLAIDVTAIPELEELESHVIATLLQDSFILTEVARPEFPNISKTRGACDL